MHASSIARPGWLRSLGGAALWTMAQHGAFFVAAWGVSFWGGLDRFGAFGQGLALSAMLSAAITFRLEYAAQLERRHRRAGALYALASRSAWAVCGALLLALWIISHWVNVPLWLWTSSLALAPQAGVLVLASMAARHGHTARAAALRSAPSIFMVLVLILALLLGWKNGIEWSIPISAFLGWIVARWASRKRSPQSPLLRRVSATKLAAAHMPFVRAELPGFLLNTAANHGQVLLMGWMGGDAAAGVLALALRVAMLPTSVFGLALADRLRARVVAQAAGADVHALIRQALKRMAALSLAVHVLAALLAPWLLPEFFPIQGALLVSMVWCLLPLGAIRLAASPLAFMLPWRGWLRASLLGQCMLFAVALLSVVLVFPPFGLIGMALAYALCAGGIYLWYIAMALKAARADT